MNKLIIICLLSSLLSVTHVYAGRYEQNRDNEDRRPAPEARQDGGEKHGRPVKNEQPRQENKDKKWRPISHNETPHNQQRNDNRQQRGNDHNFRGDHRPQRGNEHNFRGDDRQQRRDNHHDRRDDGHRHHPVNNDHRHKPIVRHHYPRHGHVVRHLPRGFIHFILHTSSYYYYDGIFYRPHQTGYVVVNAPVGAVLSELPRPFEMILVDGAPYYHAYGTYFIDAPSGFRVVANPFQPVESIPVTLAPGSDLFIYPARGQNREQQSSDRYECHRWGVSQTGFDPSTAVIPNDARLPDYRRAMSACLEARGYTVK